MYRVEVELTDVQASRLDDLARQRNMAVSDLLRVAVEALLSYGVLIDPFLSGRETIA